MELVGLLLGDGCGGGGGVRVRVGRTGTVGVTVLVGVPDGLGLVLDEGAVGEVEVGRVEVGRLVDGDELVQVEVDVVDQVEVDVELEVLLGGVMVGRTTGGGSLIDEVLEGRLVEGRALAEVVSPVEVLDAFVVDHGELEAAVLVTRVLVAAAGVASAAWVGEAVCTG